MKSETMPDGAAGQLFVGVPLGDLSVEHDDALSLESCSELEWIVVKTRGSVYDVIVLAGDTGDVMVRGGRLFPEFRRGIIAGSVFGGSAVKLRSICVGLQLELHVDGKSFVTSPIQTISRHRPPVAEGRA